MPIGKFKIYLVGHSMETTIGKKMGEFLCEKLGHKHLVFKEVQRTMAINYAEALAIWLFPYSSTLEDETHAIVFDASINDVLLERFRGGSLIKDSQIWEALDNGTEQKLHGR